MRRTLARPVTVPTDDELAPFTWSAVFERVAAVFDNNGSGVRGDLGAVVRAILLDPDAARVVEVRYAGRVTTGTGRPGVSWWSVAEPMAFDAAAGGDYIVAPSGPLTLQDANVWSHQLSLVIPLGS